ncbi:MAG: anaerobic ribonucleoside-triphosphate reductase [Christensenellales bacterium]
MTQYHIIGGSIPAEELEQYRLRAAEMFGREPQQITLMVDSKDPDMVSIDYDYNGPPFERIRRVTGYLTGSVSRWNNAKQSEEHDRIKHTLSVDDGLEWQR